MTATQKLWHVSKTHRFELFKQGLRRRAAVQPATLAALRSRHAPAVRVKATPIFEGKAAIVPRPEPPRLVEPEEQPVMMVPVAEMTMLEMRRMTEPEHEVDIAEFEHETAAAEIPEVPRPEMEGMPELERKTTVVELPEVPRLEWPRLSNEATVVELEAVVSEVQLRHDMP